MKIGSDTLINVGEDTKCFITFPSWRPIPIFPLITSQMTVKGVILSYSVRCCYEKPYKELINYGSYEFLRVLFNVVKVCSWNIYQIHIETLDIMQNVINTSETSSMNAPLPNTQLISRLGYRSNPFTYSHSMIVHDILC